MERILKTNHFARWMRKSGLTDAALCAAVAEMVAGLVDADLGGGVVKKRVGLPGRGKRGGARTVVVTNRGDRWFFVVGFGKSERANIGIEELDALKALAADLLAYSEGDIAEAIARRALLEVPK
jgi:hypothetical protein